MGGGVKGHAKRKTKTRVKLTKMGASLTCPLQQLSVAKLIVAKRTRMILASSVHGDEALGVASGGEASDTVLATIAIQSAVEVFVKLTSGKRGK